MDEELFIGDPRRIHRADWYNPQPQSESIFSANALNILAEMLASEDTIPSFTQDHEGKLYMYYNGAQYEHAGEVILKWYQQLVDLGELDMQQMADQTSNQYFDHIRSLVEDAEARGNTDPAYLKELKDDLARDPRRGR